MTQELHRLCLGSRISVPEGGAIVMPVVLVGEEQKEELVMHRRGIGQDELPTVCDMKHLFGGLGVHASENWVIVRTNVRNVP